jgi:membrane fusion protein, heavy metal efflux system
MNTHCFFHFLARAAVTVLGAVALGSLAVAGPGHDHDQPTQQATSAASPRFETHTDLFEMVGVYERGGLTLYLDRYKTNEPVTNAKLEYDAAGVKGIAAVQPDATYRIENDALKGAKGTIALAFTVTQGNDADLLAANLAVRNESQGAEHGHAHSHFPSLAFYIVASLIVVIAGLIVFFVRRRKVTSRHI